MFFILIFDTSYESLICSYFLHGCDVIRIFKMWKKRWHQGKLSDNLCGYNRAAPVGTCTKTPTETFLET